MTDEERNSRISAVVLGSARCRGFALVMVFDNGRLDALVADADPATAGDALKAIAEEYYKTVPSFNITPSG